MTHKENALNMIEKTAEVVTRRAIEADDQDLFEVSEDLRCLGFAIEDGDLMAAIDAITEMTPAGQEWIPQAALDLVGVEVK